MAPGFTLFLCGDVMTGRGIDQLQAHPSDPELRESYLKDARDYLGLVERGLSGPVSPEYVWGEALAELERVAPAARILNLETSVTTEDGFWPDKGIHYRMHPGNLGLLKVARPDVCVLANNHVLDFGHRGLVETLGRISAAGLATCGAGVDLRQALTPARVVLPDGARLWVFAMGTESSGVPQEWAAGLARPGVAFLPDLSVRTAEGWLERISGYRREGDRVMVSLHWGDNWGYEIPREQREFAHRLIEGGVDLIHGHSSHHPRPLEVYRGKLVLYGCGDFINDYEGISGHEEYRSELRLMYFPTLEARTGSLTALRMFPLQSRRLTLRRAAPEDAQWLAQTVSTYSREFGVRVRAEGDGLRVQWG